MYRPFFGASQCTFLATVLVTMEKMNAKKPYKTPVLGKISVLRTEMPIKVLPFRNYRLQAVSLVHFFLLFFHKNNLGTGLLECIVSSIKWKIYFIFLLFGHTVIYRIFVIV